MDDIKREPLTVMSERAPRGGAYNQPVESRKVVPIHLPGSLTKWYRSSSERTPIVATPPAKMGGLIDRNAAELPPLLKIRPHLFQVQQVFFPFRPIHVPGVHGLRIGFQRSFVGECPAGQVLVENLSTFIHTGPQVSVRRVGLSEQRLRCHGLMSALNNSMICWTALAHKAQATRDVIWWGRETGWYYHRRRCADRASAPEVTHT